MTDTDIEQRNARTTREFLAAWSKLSTAALLPYFTPGAVYQNMPWPALEGTAAIGGFLNAFFPITDKAQFDTSLLTTKGSLVYTERVDQFWLKAGRTSASQFSACSSSTAPERSRPGATTST